MELACRLHPIRILPAKKKHFVEMSTFFTQFPNFPYNPDAPKDDEFERLRRAQGWEPSSTEFRDQFKAFRTALVKQTGAAVDRFFTTEYPSRNFNYRRNASPWEEFRRLMRCPGVVVGRSERERAEARFMAVFNEAFNREIDKFFRKYDTFNYNPRAEPKAEFERLRHFNRWIFLYSEWRAVERKQYYMARNEFFTAFMDDFTFFFGVGEDMRDWEYLCDLLHISPLPKTPEGCQVVCESSMVSLSLANSL